MSSGSGCQPNAARGSSGRSSAIDGWYGPRPGTRGVSGRAAVLSRLVTSPEEPSSVRPVDYKGEPLDAERGPGLGCFRFQVVLLVVADRPDAAVRRLEAGRSPISVAFLFVTLLLLLFAGQTVIFLLRLVAADRREGRRRPLGSTTPTVGELEDEATAAPAPDAGQATPPDAEPEDAQPDRPGVRE